MKIFCEYARGIPEDYETHESRERFNRISERQVDKKSKNINENMHIFDKYIKKTVAVTSLSYVSVLNLKEL